MVGERRKCAYQPDALTQIFSHSPNVKVIQVFRFLLRKQVKSSEIFAAVGMQLPVAQLSVLQKKCFAVRMQLLDKGIVWNGWMDGEGMKL